ncbi:Uncharacterised protein [uncultured archaeon]|nr:Uncharacterised protein [uncultured archaeon]
MKASYLIRKAQPKDVPAIAAINSQNLLENLTHLSAEQLARRGFLVSRLDERKILSIVQDGKNGLVRVACNGAQVVGYAFAYNGLLLMRDEPQLLDTLQINPEYRAMFGEFCAGAIKLVCLDQIAVDEQMGRGAGRPLFERVLKDALKQGYQVLEDLVLLQPVRNDRSHRFHDEVGMVSVGTQTIGKNGQAYVWDLKVQFLCPDLRAAEGS